MAQLFVEDPERTDWSILRLTGGAYGISDRAVSAIVEPDGAADETGPPAILVRRELGAQEHWFLLARKNARLDLNGASLALGARLLCDHDEIVVYGSEPADALHCFFSTERQAEAAPFPGSNGTEVRCPRCKQRIEKGQVAVQCPNPSCGVWHHQHEDEGRKLHCWTYGPTCALCSHPARLDGAFRWTPEDL